MDICAGVRQRATCTTIAGEGDSVCPEAHCLDHSLCGDRAGEILLSVDQSSVAYNDFPGHYTLDGSWSMKRNRLRVTRQNSMALIPPAEYISTRGQAECTDQEDGTHPAVCDQGDELALGE